MTLIELAIQATLAQDFASHGIFTEPVTGITFFASEETNGTTTGDGEFSTVSWGGFTFGVALPPDALSRDTFEYIGLIVSLRGYIKAGIF
jgi:cellobiose dehydrogenase (acceptor)